MMKGDVNFHSNKKDPAPHTMDDQAELRSLHFSFYPCVRIGLADNSPRAVGWKEWRRPYNHALIIRKCRRRGSRVHDDTQWNKCRALVKHVPKQNKYIHNTKQGGGGWGGGGSDASVTLLRRAAWRRMCSRSFGSLVRSVHVAH